MGEEKRFRSILLEICDYVELQVRIKDTNGFILHALSNNLQSFEKTRNKQKKVGHVLRKVFFLVAVGCMIFFFSFVSSAAGHCSRIYKKIFQFCFKFTSL